MVATSFTAEVTAAVAGLSAAGDLLAAGLTHTDDQPSLPDLILVTDSRSLTDSVAGDPYRMSPYTIPVFEAIKSIKLASLLAASALFGLVVTVSYSSTKK